MRLADTLLFAGFALAFADYSDTRLAYHNRAPRVDLDYATYEGTTQSSGINEFLGMRFDGPNVHA